MKLKLILLLFALIKLSISDVCVDGTECPGNQKCCATSDGVSCCPYSDGVCCLDMKHCCPPNHKCTTKGTCEANE